LGLERYVSAFRDNDIDADVLLKLTTEDLTSIGVTSVGHRRKLLDAIANLGMAVPIARPRVFPALRQLLQQASRLPQVRCPKAFGKASIDRSQQCARLRRAMSLQPKPRETCRRSQLPGKSILAARQVEGALEMLFGDSGSTGRALQ
jgi:hypothetical protein